MRRQHHHQQKQQQQTPPSPSWKALRMRSSSLPRISIERRRKSPSNAGGEGTVFGVGDGVVGNGVRSWAKAWLPGGGVGSSSPVSPSRGGRRTLGDQDDRLRKLSPPLKQRQVRRAPVLTLALLRLDEQLPAFCQYLADPTPENVYAACALIDSTVATASPSSSSPSPGGGFSGSPSSPRSSPIRSWLTGGSSGSPTNATGSSSSAIALEGEWEGFVLPLFLLAGAESIYASLGYACDALVAHNLSVLYQRITKDLNWLREVLCDPLLASQQDMPGVFAPTLTLYYERAISLATALRALAAFTQIKSQVILLTFHSDTTRDFGAQALLFDDLLPNVPRDASSAMPMVKELEKEVQCWKYLMKTTASLEQCRFAETILSAQQCKGRLRVNSKTCIQLYMKQALQRLVAIFPIVFDRIQAFSKPLYGFEEPSMEPRGGDKAKLGGQDDLEAEVLEFLRRQDKTGGPSMAVSVALDAASSGKMKKMERGFALNDLAHSSKQQGITQSPNSALVQWPAVYMRTTVHHGLPAASSTHGGTLLDNMRRGSRSHMDNSFSTSHDGSTSTLTRATRSADASKQAAHKTKKELKVLEYAPEGATTPSWPHKEWPSLVAVLTGTGEDEDDEDGSDGIEAILTRPSIFDTFDASTSLRNLELDLKSLALPSWAGVRSDSSFDKVDATSRKLQRSSHETTSLFRISAISDFMWLVVMVKQEEESRWHRRRSSKVVEEEVNEFLGKFAAKLRMGEWFQDSSRAQELMETTTKRTTSSYNNHWRSSDLVDGFFKTDHRSWNDDEVQILLQLLKDAFRLRAPRSSSSQPLRSSYRLGFRSARSKSPKYGRGASSSSRAAPPMPDLQTSAAALFLGPDLMQAIGVL